MQLQRERVGVAQFVEPVPLSRREVEWDDESPTCRVTLRRPSQRVAYLTASSRIQAPGETLDLEDVLSAIRQHQRCVHPTVTARPVHMAKTGIHHPKKCRHPVLEHLRVPSELLPPRPSPHVGSVLHTRATARANAPNAATSYPGSPSYGRVRLQTSSRSVAGML